MGTGAGIVTGMREWAAGRSWGWRAVVWVLLLTQAVKPLRTLDGFHLFGGIIFGAHEFGHLFFGLLGNEWLTVAGGSLMQLLIPVGAAAVVLRKQDWFGVAVCALFLAAAVGDLAWYIADARARELDLVSFSPDASGHDWAYLLRRAGRLHQDRAIAGLARGVGWLIVVAATVFVAQLFLWMVTMPKPREDRPVP